MFKRIVKNSVVAVSLIVDRKEQTLSLLTMRLRRRMLEYPIIVAAYVNPKS